MNTSKTRAAIVTGASSGIGLAISRQLAAAGYHLVINARDAARLQMAATELQGRTERVITVAGDASDPKIIDECLRRCTDDLGTVPAVGVVNAGRGLPGTIMTSDDAQWAELVDVNVLGAMHQMRALATAMCAAAGSGPAPRQPYDIVVLGSTVGYNVSPFNSVYGATKFAVHGAAEGLRREVGPKGVRVSLIEPGIVGTSFQENAGYDPDWFSSYAQEIGPVLTAEDIAELVEFVVSRPPHVNLGAVSVRPTRQDYP